MEPKLGKSIDAVITYHPKDRELLGWSVAGIREHLDVARILVVCRRACRPDVERVGATFLDEDSIVEGLTFQSFSGKRWGWYFQQILKLGMADNVETQYYLCVDADTVFFRKVEFFNEAGKPLYSTSGEHHKPYFDVFEEVLGFRANRQYSFTVHHMVFNRDIVREMRERFGPLKPWYMNIVRYVEPQAPWFSDAQFNEQEVYGHYCKALYPEEINRRWLWGQNRSDLPSKALIGLLAQVDDFGSFHAHLRK